MTNETRDHLLLSALKIFAENGYEKTQLEDISKESGVSTSEIEKVFGPKERLFGAAFKFFSDEKMDIVDRTLMAPKSVEEFRDRIQLFVDEMIASHLANPYTYQIVLRETEQNNPLVAELYKETMLKVVFSVVSFFEVAKNLEYIRQDLEPRLIARIVLSIIEDVARKEKLIHSYYKRTVKDEDYRMRLSKHIVEIISRGILA